VVESSIIEIAIADRTRRLYLRSMLTGMSSSSPLPPHGTATTVLRQAEAKRNEEMVLAESSLAGERRVAWARLAMIVMFALSFEVFARLVFHRPSAMPLPRTIAVALYVAFALGALFALHRFARPNPTAAMFVPLISNTIDFGFMTLQGWFSFTYDHHIFPEMGALSLAIVIAFSVSRYSWIHVAIATAMAIAGYLALAFTTGFFSPVSTPFVVGGFLAFGLLIALTNRSLHRMFTGLRSRDNLSRFLPRQIVERVLAEGESALRPVQCEVTVLFTDIRDFTALSESMPPRDVLEFLDDYFGHMAQVVKGHDGLVNKFLGDGMLAFWGVPDRTATHAELALRAALDLRKKLDELNADRQKRGLQPVRIGVGIHTGTVAAGMLGGADQHEYTIIGDAVNVASRIEGLTKQHGTDILVSESAWLRAGDRFRGRRLAEEKVKGRAGAVVVYALDEATERS
jgi:adenylate cyclase